MQRVSILCVGKLKEKFYMDAAAEYQKRLSRHCRLEILELPEERLPDNPSPAQIQAALTFVPLGRRAFLFCVKTNLFINS